MNYCRRCGDYIDKGMLWCNRCRKEVDKEFNHEHNKPFAYYFSYYLRYRYKKKESH